MSAWDFVGGLWRRPGVESLCLELQDAHGQCVPLLLWRLWTLAVARDVPAVVVGQAIEVARAWDEAILRPLRGVRTQLKRPPALVDEAAGRDLRDRVQDLELAAERALLDTLERLSPDRRDSPESPLPAMIALAEAWRAPAPATLLFRLVATL